nr:hypothetical protein [uncultured archaeon]AQS32061.1 hypothetical protein [uncultured archaeon]
MGIVRKFGDIVLAKVQYVDTSEIKERPALILFEEHGNIVVAGITSNLNMVGIPLSKKEGIKEDSIIKLNYIFTIPEGKITRGLLSLSSEKKEIVISELLKRLK